MGFFHAFYFVSYMATTIGFGEIPYAFTDAQRIWVLFSIYATVVVWLYAISTLLTLVQDKAFQNAITEQRFARHIKQLKESFYIVCGYGETGSALVSALTERQQNVVVIDDNVDRINLLELENLRQYVPGLQGDAGKPIHLQEAGLEHPLCNGVIAVTNHNDVNLKIAVASKLLNPKINVICRADSHEVEANMSSFGTDYIIDPFDTFALHLSTAIQLPSLYVLYQWLSGKRYQLLNPPIYPPQKGRWIICGFGRFGKTVYQQLKNNNITPIIIEATPDKTGLSALGINKNDWITGWGTEASTLEQADIHNAVGLIAGTDNDANNLSIIMTAKELNPSLFVVARNNLANNEQLFAAIHADIVMHPSSIIANKIQGLLATPLLYEFTALAIKQDAEWASAMLSQVRALVDKEVPEVWQLTVNDKEAHAVNNVLIAQENVTLNHLLSDSLQRDRSLCILPLLLCRNGKISLQPDKELSLQQGDTLLLCGRLSSRDKMEWTLLNEHALRYVMTGESKSRSSLWQWLWSL